jgi:hypothetical protein
VIQNCYKQDEFIARIQRTLGSNLDGTSCYVVDQSGMAGVMAKAGWSRNQSAGVVGFQLGKNVYVLDSAPWTVLHELIHRAGVNSDRLSRFVAEGLTEAIAIEIKKGADEHKPTYPTETRWVRTKLLPRLNMTAVQLGRILIDSSNPPRTLADLMLKVDPKLDRSTLENQLQPQRSEQPSFNLRGHVTRGQTPLGPDRTTEGVAVVFLTAGLALSISALARRGSVP